MSVIQNISKAFKIFGYTVLGLVILLVYFSTVYGLCERRPCVSANEYLAAGWSTIVCYAILVYFIKFFYERSNKSSETEPGDDTED